MAVRDGTTVYLYVDGVQVDSDTNVNMTGSLTPTAVTIGQTSAATSSVMYAAHAQAWIGTALSSTQAAMVAEAALNGRLAGTTSGFITAVADLCGLPSGLRSVTASSQSVGPYAPSDAWTAMQIAARSDPGRLFVNRSGVLTFEPRTTDMGAPAVAAFADDSTAGAIRYAGYELESTDRWVFNDITVTGVNSEGTASDSTSKATYDTLTLSTDTILPDAGSCRSLAATLLSRYKDPAARGSGWVCDPTDDAQLAAVLALELGDIVTVKRTPKVGSAHTSTVQITSTSHTVEPTGVTVSFSGAPVDTTAAGIWGSGLWGTALWG